ncbi:uncharacterized protein K02A2.6-like [Diachasma alloeum]|uniref:uncharacterized protein K02A2.6-like n=1 Tax=Diachasma alloeum TaxID=454923 RepID=UPI0007382D39|nr:uncharacterized protein K02A2.6-like [Diachasma alloeum]
MFFFGVPLRITTNQGRQFESHLFKHLNSLAGTTHLRTTAYHPAANGMVERFHRQLKAAIKCHDNSRWTQVLPTVLLSIRAAWKEDLQASAAELAYGEPLRLPGDFLAPTGVSHQDDPADYVKDLRQHFADLRPAKVKRHGEHKTFMFKDLATAEQVFVRHDAPKGPFQMPYQGPFKVIHRNTKMFIVHIKSKDVNVSIDRLKPAYVIADDQPGLQHPSPRTPTPEYILLFCEVTQLFQA